NQKRGVRWTTAKAFLRPARRRRNLAILTHAQVARLTIEAGRVTGILYRQGGPGAGRADGKLRRATARVEVVLAAGAVGSPHLLELSGIGSADRLADLGIAPVADRRDVGENLQDHLQIRLAYRVTGARTLNEASHSM